MYTSPLYYLEVTDNPDFGFLLLYPHDLFSQLELLQNPLSGFETQRRRHQKYKTEVPVAPKFETSMCFHENENKKNPH